MDSVVCFWNVEKEDLEKNLEDLDGDCWSMAVNIENNDIGPEAGAWSWFESLRDRVIVKVDTGQNLMYCVQVLGLFLGALWDMVCSMLGYKERFGGC